MIFYWKKSYHNKNNKLDEEVMELTFLGTSAGVPTKERNVTSMILNLVGIRKSYWLFDCGEGTQHRILNSPFKTPKIEKIFITHNILILI